jgi:hypothetical protein
MHKIIKLILNNQTNNPKSAYALRILNNRHEFSRLHTPMQLLKLCTKGWPMNSLEDFYIQLHQQKGFLIHEQNLGEINPLFSFAFN